MKVKRLRHIHIKNKSINCLYCGEKLKDNKGGRIYCFDCFSWQNGSWRTIIFERDKGKCFYCGIKLTTRTFSVDHVVPVSEHGRNIANNIVCCCHRCNNKKSTSRLKNETEILLEIRTRNSNAGIHNELVMPMYRFGPRGWETELSYLSNRGN